MDLAFWTCSSVGSGFGQSLSHSVTTVLKNLFRLLLASARRNSVMYFLSHASWALSVHFLRVMLFVKRFGIVSRSKRMSPVSREMKCNCYVNYLMCLVACLDTASPLFRTKVTLHNLNSISFEYHHHHHHPKSVFLFSRYFTPPIHHLIAQR